MKLTYVPHAMLIAMEIVSVYLQGVPVRVCELSNYNKTADCSGKRLRNVPNVTFIPSTVEEINLSNNEIDIIRNISFFRFKTLRVLHLENNNISKLEIDAFFNLTNLEYLSLKNNTINVADVYCFPSEVLTPLLNLTTLILSQNLKLRLPDRDEKLTYSKGFGRLPAIANLSIDLFPDPEFPSAFSNMTSLMRIDFDLCYLRELRNDTFLNLPPNIKELHITNCRRISSTVGIGALEHLIKLNTLNLKGTLITLPSALRLLYSVKNHDMNVINFYGVNRIAKWGIRPHQAIILTNDSMLYLKEMCVKVLNLAFNSIVQVKFKTLFGMKRADCLEELVLSGNGFHISSFLFVECLYFFSRCTNLQIFEYSFAPIEYPDYCIPEENKFEKDDENSESRSSNSEIEQQILSYFSDMFPNHNYLDPSSWNDNIPVWMYKNITLPPKLHTLRLSHITAYIYVLNYSIPENNSIHTVDVSYSTFQNLYVKMNGFQNVKYVDFSGIDLTKSLVISYQTVPNVETLILKDSNLDRVFMNPDMHGLFQNNTRVRYLDISYNHLTDIPPQTLSPMKDLESIDLSYNSLDTFPRFLLDFAGLKVINLSNNKLVGFNKTMIELLDKKTNVLRDGLQLYLHGNGFLCTCEYMDFISWIYVTPVILSDFHSDYTCILTKGLKMKRSVKEIRTHFSEIFGDCNSTFWLIFSVGGICTIFLLLLISILCFRLRWRIIYFYYRHIKFNQELSLENTTNCIFDAYIAYSDEDYQWNCRTLRGKLEDDFGFKICLRDRDFIVGDFDSKNIIFNICSSRKVIIDATPSYVKSKWFEFELEMAKLEILKKRDENGIIIIIRNGTEAPDMPDVFKEIWTRAVCIILDDDNIPDDDIFERIHQVLLK